MAISNDAQDVAQAVVDTLQAAPASTWTLSPSFARRTDTRREKADLTNDPLVDVIAVDRSQTDEDREADRGTFPVAIAVRGKLNGTDNEDVDPWHAFVNEITKYLNRRQLTGFSPEHWWDGDVEFPVLVSDEMLKQHVFFSVQIHTYGVVA